MSDNGWKSWVIVAALMVGGIFEVMKHMPSHETPTWENENLRFATGQPYSLHPREEAPRVHHVGGDQQKVLDEAMKNYVAATAPKKGSFKDKAPVTVKKDKNGDEWELVTDPRTGKKVWRKKKKKTAKKDAKKDSETAKAPQPQKPKEVPPTEDENQLISLAVAQAAKTGVVANLPAQGSGQIRTLEEWKSLLLGRPNLTETKNFIRDFQDHLVTSDVFYKITAMMIEDSRPEMKQLGLLCAGASPSVQSFELLAEAEKANGNSSQISPLATKYLQVYSRYLSYLTIMQNVLRSGDNYSQLRAMQLVDTLAQSTLKGGATPNPSAQSGSVNAQKFQAVLAIIAQLKNSPDTSLASQASQTASDLQGLGVSASMVALQN